MANSAPDIIFGAASVARLTLEEYEKTFSALKKHNVKALDTAFAYPDSELTLGRHAAPKEFAIHTKAPAFGTGALSKQSILDGMEKSLKDLKVDAVDLYYLHAPDVTTPIEETLTAIQELYAAGKFKRFGISNYLPRDVQKIYDIQSAAKSVLPTVYQGNYNAITRVIEGDLFPLLRKLRIQFYAYSPIAGGFLVKTSDQVRSRDVEGRFNGKEIAGQIYTGMYAKESMYKALDEWQVIAKDAGISKAALAYRWVTYHSALSKESGDALIFGASSIAQLEETLTAIEAGALDAHTVGKVNDIWDIVKHEAPKDNANSYIIDLQ